MKVLLTGCNGYIGSVLSQLLLERGYDIVGLDINYFESCFLKKPVHRFKIIKKDIRDLNTKDISGFDAIIHLAGLSNDPLGEFDPKLTKNINYASTVNLANIAKKKGVKRFIYASSQSMYGISDSEVELDEHDSEKKPVTAYASTKWEAEIYLMGMHSNSFSVSCFRPSTVFGASPRLRCDIVFNNLVACAYTTGKIEVLSDGTPWRPVVHVRDVCKAFISGLEAPIPAVGGKAFNVGIPNGNFTVKDLAVAAQKAVPGCELIFLNQHTDPRTYKVSFDRILKELSDFYKPSWDLDRGAKELVNFFEEVGFSENDFRGNRCNRLAQLKYLMENAIINKKLELL